MKPLTNPTLSTLSNSWWKAHLQQMDASINHHFLVRTHKGISSKNDIIKQAKKALEKATKEKAKIQSDFITAFLKQ